MCILWSKKVAGAEKWHHVEICENRDLLVLAAYGTLFRLDWDSNIKWKKEISAHHDICIDKEGEIVWEFYNPQIDTENKERGSIYRMARITDPEIAKLINTLIQKI